MACAASIAIKAAATQIEADASAVYGKIADLDKRIEALAYQEMLTVFARMHADLLELSGQVRSRVAEAYSCRDWILAIARDLNDKGLNDRAREYFNLAGEMKTFAMPEFAPSSGEVVACVHTWQSRFSNLVCD